MADDSGPATVIARVRQVDPIGGTMEMTWAAADPDFESCPACAMLEDVCPYHAGAGAAWETAYERVLVVLDEHAAGPGHTEAQDRCLASVRAAIVRSGDVDG